jgi:hypothetical protein
MGFVGEVLDNVAGIHIYYIIGLLIFIALFLVMLVRTIKMPKTELIDIKTSILDNNEVNPND